MDVFGAHGNRVTMGGQFFPNGQGVAVDDGYNLSGAWQFGSGTGHAEYIAAGFVPVRDGEITWIAEGLPEMRVAILPRAEVIFDDGDTNGWFVLSAHLPKILARTRHGRGNGIHGRRERSQQAVPPPPCHAKRPAVIEVTDVNHPPCPWDGKGNAANLALSRPAV